MGSPISPFFADLVMEELEIFCWNRLKTEFNIIPNFYFHYVDDSICCIKKDDIHKLNQVFNNFDPNLKFTYEIEINNSINFLDVSLIKHDGNIITVWYLKSMSTNRTLNFYSNHPVSLKKNIVFNLIDRAILLSDKCFHNKNILRVKNILNENSYPP